MTMKDPVRLLEGAGSAAEQAVLRAGAAEQPSEAARQRLAVALGLTHAAQGGEPTRTTRNGPTTPTTRTSTPAGAPNALNAAAPLAVKWLVVTLGAAGIGTALLATQPSPDPSSEAPTASTASPPSAEAPAPAKAAPSASEPALAPPVRAPFSEPAPPSAAAATARHRGQQASVAREIAQLDAVRALLAGGNPSAANAALRDYSRDHAAGVLAQEASLLRIEALLGDRTRARVRSQARARMEAARFLRDYPQSPHANRIQALLDDAR